MYTYAAFTVHTSMFLQAAAIEKEMTEKTAFVYTLTFFSTKVPTWPSY
jgi:hypothetical protein